MSDLCACDLSTGKHADECEYMTLDEIRAMAKERGVYGPDVAEHPEEYDGECYCWSCLEYMQ